MSEERFGIEVSWREHAEGQCSVVHVHTLATGTTRVVAEVTDVLVEAPNWSEGDLVLNGGGHLQLIAADGSGDMRTFELPKVPALNNDHVLDPDGQHIFVSAHDWHIYRASLRDGSATRVTQHDHERPLLHFLHGVSPDGAELAFVGVPPDAWNEANIYTVPSTGGAVRQLTHNTVPSDGSEYSPDGQWIYFNTEAFSTAPGHAQLARMRPDGSDLTQLTFDDRVNWFPHPSPDGQWLSYVSFEPGTIGHPADRAVEIRLVPVGRWNEIRTVASLCGGQGSMNVGSWSPDSAEFAFVSYPIDQDATA